MREKERHFITALVIIKMIKKMAILGGTHNTSTSPPTTTPFVSQNSNTLSVYFKRIVKSLLQKCSYVYNSCIPHL